MYPTALVLNRRQMALVLNRRQMALVLHLSNGVGAERVEWRRC